MKQTLNISEKDVHEVANEIVAAFIGGNKVFVAGNGGSACDALHFSGELICTYKDKKRKGLPVICLNDNIAAMTAWANDKSYDDIFARQLEALGREEDIFIGLSTSGKSKNITKAFEMADRLGMQQILITGRNDACPCNWIIRFNTKDTPRIQEHTIYFLHEVCDKIEQKMAKKG